MKKKTTIREEKRYWFLIDKIRENGYTIGAEVGCERGNTTMMLMKEFPELIIYAVDLWEWQPRHFTTYSKGVYKDWNFEEIKETFDIQTDQYKDRIIELRGLSWEMANEVEDNSLDFVFIDADHGYRSVKKDIIAWTPKLKPNGMLSGHDINLIGVIRATGELIGHRVQSGEDKCWYCKKEDVQL